VVWCCVVVYTANQTRFSVASQPTDRGRLYRISLA
jgi:hypothetical protein